MQNNKILDKTLFSMTFPAYKGSVKFIEVIQNVLEILALFNNNLEKNCAYACARFKVI